MRVPRNVAQEAMVKAVRHGSARLITVILVATATKCVLTIIDNGLGIPTKHCRSAGTGLRITRYRARLIGGCLDVHALERGTRVRCLQPRK